MKLILISFLCFLFACSSHKMMHIDLCKQDDIEVNLIYENKQKKTIHLAPFSTIADVYRQVGEENTDIQRYDSQQILHHGDTLYFNSQVNNKVSINKASIEELQTLPGIGKNMAQKIIQYRKENGLFKKIEDLLKVQGIGHKKYEKIQHQIIL